MASFCVLVRIFDAELAAIYHFEMVWNCLVNQTSSFAPDCLVNIEQFKAGFSKQAFQFVDHACKNLECLFYRLW